MKHKYLIAAAVLVVAAVGFFAFAPQQSQADELTGSWRGGGTTPEGTEWWVQYDFEGNSYEMTTGTDYGEVGTYKILERFEDKSMIVRKIFDNQEKVYDVTMVLVEDGSQLFIEGMELKRQE